MGSRSAIVKGGVMSLRKDWVEAKAEAAKRNGGKDVWRDNKLKEMGLGAALDAFEAAETKFDAVDTKFALIQRPTKQQENAWIAAGDAYFKATAKVNEIAREYLKDLKKLKSRGILTKAKSPNDWPGAYNPLYSALTMDINGRIKTARGNLKRFDDKKQWIHTRTGNVEFDHPNQWGNKPHSVA